MELSAQPVIPAKTLPEMTSETAEKKKSPAALKAILEPGKVGLPVWTKCIPAKKKSAETGKSEK